MSNPLISGVSTPKDPQWLGIYNGIVVNANDPTGAGRVQVQCPQVLGNAVSNWAQSMQTGTAPPAAGTQVWVQFLGGNANAPYYNLGLSTNVVEDITSNTSTVLNANAFFVGGDISQWAGVNGTISAIQPNPNTSPPFDYACQIVATGTGGMLITEMNDPFIAIAGNDYSISAWVYYPLGGDVTIGATFNVTGSSSQETNTFSVPAATWTTIEFAATAPTGATTGYPIVGPAQGNIGDIFDAEAVTVTGQLDGNLIVASTIQSDSVNFTAQEIGANNITINTDGTQPNSTFVNVGDLWFDGSNDYVLNQWNGSAWVPYQFGTNAIQAGSITAGQIAAGAVIAGVIAAGAIDGFTINGVTINGQTISAADIIIQQGDGGLFYYTTGGSNQVVKTYNSSGTWQAPTGVTTVQVQCWGAGGGGASGASGCGGGAGEYAEETSITVVPGNTYSFTIHNGGAGGAADSGTANNGSNGGGSTVFTGASGGANAGVVTAHAGSGGTTSPGSGGTGSTATIHYHGGSGGTGGGSGGTTTYQKQYNALNTYSYSGSDSYGTPNLLGSYGSGGAIQGGYSPDTYNGNTYSFLLFPTSQMVSDFGNASAINFFTLTLKNIHSWNSTGNTWVLGWNSRSTFPSTLVPPSSNIGLATFSTGENKTTTSGNLPFSIGGAFQSGTAHSIVLYTGSGPASTDLVYYGNCVGGSGPGCPFITVNYDVGNSGGAGGGGTSTTANGGSGANGAAFAAGAGGAANGGAGGTGVSGSSGATAGASPSLIAGGGGGGLNVGSGDGAAGGTGGKGQIVLTYTPAGSAGVLGGSIAGEAGTDPISSTAFPEGASFDNLTAVNTSTSNLTLLEESTPATPTLGPLLYGTSAGYGKYVGTDGNAYQMGKMVRYNVLGTQSITLASQTGFYCSNTVSGTMDFPIVSGQYYLVRGNVNWATTGTTFQRWNFGNQSWTGDITLNTWDNNVSNSASLTSTITANGIFDMPLTGGSSIAGNNWFTDINGFFKATTTGILTVQGGCSPGPGASWTFNLNSWFSLEPVS